MKRLILLILCTSLFIVQGNSLQTYNEAVPQNRNRETITLNSSQSQNVTNSPGTGQEGKDGKPANSVTLSTDSPQPTTAPITTIMNNTEPISTIITTQATTPATSTVIPTEPKPEPTKPEPTKPEPTKPSSEPTKPSSEPTNPTTKAPQTTTHLPITSTTALPFENAGRWTVNDTNTTCIIIQMSIQFNVTYTDDQNKTVYEVFDMPSSNKTTKATGICNNTAEQNITISWQNDSSSILIHFVKEESKPRYNIHHLNVKLAPSYFPKKNLNEPVSLMYNATAFTTTVGDSYRCLKLQKLDLIDVKNQSAGYLAVTGLQFQAFKSDKTQMFGLAEDCAFDTPDVVPIAVGCALAALVIVVLIAYLWSRRRREARGYLSM
ncbi:lysosome-associated membrane glycoprotein 1-like [Prorops nasuta]|uniref:lysosome-associated membrane glycoprotein 1-like n=1 Tax=Prorops nasuta TaxID=863751 RepID=UPI0034CDC97B